MNQHCKNCGHTFPGNFCSHCGQSANTHRLNLHSIWMDIRYGIFHFNDKIFFTAKQLVYRPGYAIHDYLEGKRLKYFQPISFVIILATFYGLLGHAFHLHIVIDNGDVDPVFAKLGLEKINDWIINHYSWIALLSVPLFTISTYLAFKKHGYNFVEHLAINSFLTAQRFLFLIVCFPIIHWLNDSPYFTLYTRINLFLEFLLMYWGFSQLFPQLPKTKILKLLIFAAMILFALILVVSVIIAWFLEYFV